MTSPSLSSARPVRTTVTAGYDLLHGLLKWEIWGRLGWFEIKRRYRRTVIGPFWGAVSIAVFVLAMGRVGSGLFHRPASEYLPFLASGMVVWIMVSTMVTEACNLFMGAEHLFRRMRFDYSILAYALVWRNYIAFLHNLSVYLVIALLFAPHLLGTMALMALPGLALVGLNAVWLALLLGMLCLRFRDVQQLIASLMQLAIFVTPIFWAPSDLPDRPAIVLLNPLYYLVEVVRAPLMGEMPGSDAYLGVFVITALGGIATFFVFRKYRKRIAYWS